MEEKRCTKYLLRIENVSLFIRFIVFVDEGTLSVILISKLSPGFKTGIISGSI